MERQFILVNKKNEELSFNSSDIFGHTPEGLGMEIEGTTYQAYNSFNDMVLTVKQNEINLKLTLGNDSRKPYATYMYLLKFLNVGGLILRYIVPDVGTFERKIALRSLSKKDMDLYSVLQEEIKFSAMTPWYSWVTLSKNFDRVFNAGRIWDDSRIYQTKYAYSWSNTGLPRSEVYAYAYNKTGTDRFSLEFPRFNLLSNSKFPDNTLVAPWGNYSNGGTVVVSNGEYNYTTPSTGTGSGQQGGLNYTDTSVMTTQKSYVWSAKVKGSGMIRITYQYTYTDGTKSAWIQGGDTTLSTSYSLAKAIIPPQTKAFTKVGLTLYFQGTSTGSIKEPKLEEGTTATTWMPTESEALVTDFPMYLGKTVIINDVAIPTDPKYYEWIPSDLTGPIPPVVYRGDFTREFPRLNLSPNTNMLMDINNNFIWGNRGAATNTITYEKILVPNHPNLINGIRVTQTTTGQAGWRGPYYSQTTTASLPCSPSTKYTASVWIKNNATTDLHIALNLGVSAKVDQTSPKFSSTDIMVPADGAWHYITYTHTTNEDSIVMWPYVYTAIGTTSADFSFVGYKLELGSTSTPWMPSISEVTADNYPTYLGTYSGLGNPDLNDPLMYSWNRYNHTIAVDTNIIPDPTFVTNPPLLSNTESKKIGDTWQVFNTGTNTGSVVSKTSDGLRLVNTSGNKLYLRPNQMFSLVSNNKYRLEYDITVSSISSSNDMYIVFTNQSQIPNYVDIVDSNNPYIKIPLTGEVTTNLVVDFNPISIRNVKANTKCRRIIDFTVPSGYQFGIIQAVNSNQSTTIYNNFDLSYPTETINKPANGPYSIISPKTNIYQIDYSRSASYLEIDNDSMYFGTQTDSSLRMVIKATATTGRIDNPSWYLTDDAGNKIQTEGFLTGIPVGYELVVSSDPFERYMVLRDSSGNLPDTEIDQFIDPMVTGWIRVPVGISKLVLSDTLYSATGGFNAGSVSLEYKKEWVIV